MKPFYVSQAEMREMTALEKYVKAINSHTGGSYFLTVAREQYLNAKQEVFNAYTVWQYSTIEERRNK